MTPDHHALMLFGGVLGVLLFATLIERVLALRAAPEPASPVMENLRDRIRAWWVMAALVGLAFLAGKIGLLILFAFASFMALREFLTLMHTRRGDHWALFTAFFVVLPIQYYLIAIDWYGLYSIFIPVYAFLLLPVIASLRGDPQRFMDRIAELQWGLMTCVFCISHVPALLTLKIPGYEGRELLLVAFLIIVVQANDVLQYVWGKLLGGTRIAPTLTPSKTVEGLIGGVTSATALGTGLWWITPFRPWQAAALSLVITVIGFLGGLVMSAIKRDRGVKDWGRMIRGHGGMLDRIDSVVFAAPIFFHLTRYWFTV